MGQELALAIGEDVQSFRLAAISFTRPTRSGRLTVSQPIVSQGEHRMKKLGTAAIVAAMILTGCGGDDAGGEAPNDATGAATDVPADTPSDDGADAVGGASVRDAEPGEVVLSSDGKDFVLAEIVTDSGDSCALGDVEEMKFLAEDGAGNEVWGSTRHNTSHMTDADMVMSLIEAGRDGYAYLIPIHFNDPGVTIEADRLTFSGEGGRVPADGEFVPFGDLEEQVEPVAAALSVACLPDA